MADDQALMAERGVRIEAWGPPAEGRNNIFGDPTLSAIGEAHGKSVAQVGSDLGIDHQEASKPTA